MDQQRLKEIVETLSKHGQRNVIVLSGVGGTGKTHYALRAAELLTGSPLFVAQVQFHPNFGYEDLMEGLRPNVSGGFNLENGSLMDWNEQAHKDRSNTYVFLIEELTRANVSAVLGELFTYIEYRDRIFMLPISKRKVSIAPNLRILATMNPQDRSALELDDALIRRLRILQFPPSVPELNRLLDESLAHTNKDEADRIRVSLTAVFTACQQQYPDTFEQMMPFGHAIFANVATEADLKDLWHQQIRHLLQRNPNVPAHPFRDTIQGQYPWK